MDRAGRGLSLFLNLSLSIFVSCLLLFPCNAYPEPAFFKGKTVILIQGRKPGGTGDMRARAVMAHLPKHIPGHPTIVTQYMPGGGGRKAGNHIYRAVRADGLTIANIGGGFVSNAILGQPGVRYDVDRVAYLGSGNSRSSYVFLTRKEIGADTLAKLRAASGIRIGAQSVGHDVYVVARLFSWLLGLTRPQFVTGYSGSEIDFALLRGEVDARANITDTIMRRTPDWIKKGRVNFHSVLEIPKGFRLAHPAFAGLPALETFARTDGERQILETYRTFRLIGSPYILPPGVPRDRVEVLRNAFRKLFKDPQFLKTWKKLTGADAHPLMPEEQAKAVRTIPRNPEFIRSFKRIAGAGPLPPR